MTAFSVLVTGASGFLGSHLARRLVADGARVHVLVRRGSSLERISDVLASIHPIEADLQDQGGLDRALAAARPRVVFHAAGFTGGRDWRDPADAAPLEQSFDVNVTGTLRLLLAVCRQAPDARVVRIGGLEEYGGGALPYREHQREAPVSAYSASQTAATHLAEMFHHRFGVSLVTLRPALVYGPTQATRFFVPALIAACLANGRFAVTAADHTRDIVYVDDVVDACVRAGAADGVAGERINVGTGHEWRLRDLTDLIVRLAGGNPTIAFGTEERPTSNLARLVCDPSQAKRLLGWQAVTSIETGLTKTIAWYRGTPSHSFSR